MRGFLGEALCRIGEKALPALQELYNDADPVLRECAELTLWRMGEPGISAMVKSLEDEPGN